MTDMARWYRLMLHAYPRWYRRERGDEIVTTLLDAAGSGRRRPTWREVRDLLGSGLRCRLRPPRGAGYRITTVVLAALAALAGLAVAGVLSLPAAPSEPRALVAATAAIPGPHRVVGPTTPCDRCPDWDRGPLNRRDYVAVLYDLSPGEVEPMMAAARNRLAVAGWSVDRSVTVDPDSAGSRLLLHARKDGVELSLTGELGQAYLDKDLTRPDPAFMPVVVVVTRTIPVYPLLGGLLAGLLIGWLATSWTLQRFKRHGWAVRRVMLAGGAPVLLLAGLLEAMAGQWVLALSVFGNWAPGYLRTPAVALTGAPWLFSVATVLVLATMAVAAIPFGPRPIRAERMPLPVRR